MNNKLKELIQLLNSKGYETRKEISIELDLKSIDKDITILYNNQFKIEYSVDNNKLKLETTFSNQVIDFDYMKQINFLFDRVAYYNA